MWFCLLIKPPRTSWQVLKYQFPGSAHRAVCGPSHQHRLSFHFSGRGLSPWVTPACPGHLRCSVPPVCVRSQVMVLLGWNSLSSRETGTVWVAHVEPQSSSFRAVTPYLGKGQGWHSCPQSETELRFWWCWEGKPPGQGTGKGWGDCSFREGRNLPVCSGQSVWLLGSRMSGLDLQTSHRRMWWKIWQMRGYSARESKLKDTGKKGEGKSAFLPNTQKK